MPGVRLDRFLASTAVVLFLSTAAGGALAEQPTDPSVRASLPLADAANATAGPAQSSDATETPETTGATSTGSPTEPATPAAAVPPEPEAPTPAASATPAGPTAPTAKTAEHETPSSTAAAPATTPETAASTLSAADAPIAEQLQQLASGKYDRLIGGKTERITIDAFYSGRNYAPLWLTDGHANARAKAAIDYLGHVGADGLDPADYPVPNFAGSSDPAALADAELRLTMSIITYAHHASVGRVHWSRVSADISYNEKAPEAPDVLAAMVETKDVGAALAAYEPHTPGYLALKAKLADIRAGKGDDSAPPIPNGPAPKVGAQDDRVPQLRERLGVAGDGGDTYDKALADAVKKFQENHDLKATGLLTPATIEALNGRRPDRATDVIIANMERWRWMPHDLGDTYVIVNLPDYTLRVMHDGKQVWMTRIVVGKPTMPTPIMNAEMKYITINPTWNVPPSIVNHEYLPALAQDPTVLQRMGLVVSHNPDGSVHISQPPGDKNALGRVRFNFPNKFLVYQHDTPDKYMFAYDKRAFSHGCMRVQDPVKYAEVLLSLVRPGDGYTEDRIHRMFAGPETDIQFPTFIPVNLTYQTAFVDDAGKLEFREDIYGRDRALLALLNGNAEERRVADVAVDHKVDIAHRQVLAVPDQPSLWGGWGGGADNNGRNYYASQNGNRYGSSQYGNRYASQNDGGGFFARLFGGGLNQPQPVPHKPVQHRRESRAQDTVQR